MSTTMGHVTKTALPVRAEKFAKSDLRKADTPDFRVHIGAAILRAMHLRGWSLKELAAHVDHDPRQVARWIAGTERPHMDALFAVIAFQQPLVQALSELAGADVEITVRLRRSA